MDKIRRDRKTKHVELTLSLSVSFSPFHEFGFDPVNLVLIIFFDKKKKQIKKGRDPHSLVARNCLSLKEMVKCEQENAVGGRSSWTVVDEVDEQQGEEGPWV